MLRITVRGEAGYITVKVEGKVVGPWVHELEACCRTSKQDAAGMPIVIDLAGVTFIDADGKTLLSRLRQQGVGLVATDLVRGWIEDCNSNSDT